MGDFQAHFRAGVIGAAVTAIAALSYGIGRGLAVSTIATLTVGVFAATLVGSVIPDVDVHSSIPRRYFGRLLVVAGVGVGGFFALDNPTMATTIGAGLAGVIGLANPPVGSAAIVGGGLLLALGLLVAKAAGYALDEFTTHRGFAHSLAFAGLFGAGVAFLTSQISLFTLSLAGLVGVAGTIGVVIHTRIVDR